jgi:serine hydrolase
MHAMPFLILHGWQGSGPDHWQTWLADRLRERGHEVSYPELPDPDEPSLDGWLAAFDEHLSRPEGLVVLCHSLACIVWLHRARTVESAPVERALLVAPPSGIVDTMGLPGFFPLQAAPADVGRAARSTLLVHSDDDPYCPEGAGSLFAEPLGIRAELLPGAGHINTDAGYGPWPALERWCLGETGGGLS